MRVTITGATGFAGSHLAELALSKGAEVWGTRRWRSPMDNVKHIKNDIHWTHGDLTDPAAVRNILEESRPDWVFHLAAQSYVPASFTQPRETFHTNVQSQINLLHGLREGLFGRMLSIGCYDSQTRAFTEEGFKSWDKIKNGDNVLSIDPKTGITSYKRIKKVIVQKNYKGSMYHFKHQSIDLLVTPNHRMVYFKPSRQKKEKILISRADCLTGTNIIPNGITDGKSKDITNDEAYLIGLFIGDGFLAVKKRKFLTSGLNNQDKLRCRNKKSGKFNGTGLKNIKKEYLSVGVGLCIPLKDKARKKTELVLKRLGYPINSGEIELYFTPSKRHKDFFEKCGKYAKNKKIPKFIFKQSMKILRNVYDGLIDSDGNYMPNGAAHYTTVSASLKNDIIELCHRIGKGVCPNLRKPRSHAKINGRTIYSGESWEMSITSSRKKLTSKSGDWKIVDYSGIVWCVEVEDNGTLLVERKGKTMFCGNSSEEYGLVNPDEVPIKETNPLRPLSPYAVSKVTQDLLAYQYNKSYKIHVVRARAFNHEGPRRGEVFVTSNFAKQIVEAEKGIRPKTIYHGNLNAIRDFTDVRDTVKAYWMLLDRGRPGDVYNISNNKGWPIHFMLKTLIDLSTVKGFDFHIDEKRMRPSDVPILVGDNEKIWKETGWQPTIKFEKTMEDLLEFWRKKIYT